MKSILLFCGLALCMLGCPDNTTTPGDSGGTPSGGMIMGGQIGGSSGGELGGSTVGNTCAVDADCGSDQYCAIEEVLSIFVFH